MRPVLLVLLPAAAVALAGCGGGGSSATAGSSSGAPRTVTIVPATTTYPAGPVFTDASDVAACAQLERTVANVSSLVSGSTEAMTQAVHPAQLAKLTGQAQRSLLYSAKVLAITDAPKPLLASRNQLVAGLRLFAADFGKAKRLTAKNNLAAAASVLGDRQALGMIQVSAKHIDDLCGA